MSVDAGLNIKFVSNVSSLDIILNLIDVGWLPKDYDGSQTYLPLDDQDDDYTWTSNNISINKLLEILKQKQVLNQRIGLVLTWKDTKIGGEFFFLDDDSLMVSISVERQVIYNTNITDVSWYIEKIIPLLLGRNIVYESFKFFEHI